MAQSKISTLIDARIHVLYCGVTQSGKTTLARMHARLLSDAGYDVAVYDPMGTATAGGDWPPEAVRFSDKHEFLAWLAKTRGTDERPWFVFVDEAADIFGHAEKDAQLIPRVARHQGVYLRLISQRPKMLPPNVRSQCAHAYVFRLASDDLRMIAADYGHGESVYNAELDTGDFLVLISGASTIDEANVFEIVD